MNSAAEQLPTYEDGERYEFGPFRLDCAARELVRGDEVLPLTPKAFDVLRVLVIHHERVVTKDELLKVVWPDSFVSEDSLTQNVAVLRRILGDSHGEPKYISTIPKHGYRFVASVRQVQPPSVAARLLNVEPPKAVLSAVPPLEVAPRPVPTEPMRSAPALKAPVQRISLRWASLVAAAALVTAAASLTAYLNKPPQVDRIVRFAITPPENTTFVSTGRPSPDGRQLAFLARDATGKTMLWVRSLDSFTARPLEGTEGAAYPFWSARGDALGFFADEKLKMVNVAGGPPQTITSIATRPTSAGAWNESGILLFPERRSGIFSVPVSGGVPTQVTTPDPSLQETSHTWPQFLPDGRHFLYGARSADPARNALYVGSLGSSERIRVLPSVVAAIYASGRLFFVRDGALLAQPFNVSTFHVEGVAEPVAGDAALPLLATGITFSAAPGIIAYLNTGGPNRLAWFDRTGRTLGVFDEAPTVYGLELSPDDRQLTATDTSAAGGIWLFDVQRQVGSRLTVGSNSVWAPDGSQLALSSPHSTGVLDLHMRPSGAEREDLLLRTGESLWAEDWSADGRYIVYAIADPTTKLDLWVLPTTGDRKPQPYLQSPYSELQAQVSPDSRWLAYTSDESGSFEVYLQSFPTPGAKRTVSIHGGWQPRWRRDGKELYYIARDRKLMAVDIRSAGNTLEVGIPKPLFQTRITGDLTSYEPNYAVTSDGSRFLVNSDSEHANQLVNLILSWRPTQ